MKWTKTSAALFWVLLIVLLGLTAECRREALGGPVVDLSDGLGWPPASST